MEEQRVDGTQRFDDPVEGKRRFSKGWGQTKRNADNRGGRTSVENDLERLGRGTDGDLREVLSVEVV